MAHHRHKRDTNARRFSGASVMAASLALLVTAPAVAVGVLASEPPSDAPAQADAVRATLRLSDVQSERGQVSRAGSRYARAADERAARQLLRERAARAKREAEQARQQAEQRATQRAVREADTRLWTTSALNLWSAPERGATKFGVLKAGAKVLVTGRRKAERVELALEGKSRWVTSGYLSQEKPQPEEEEEGAVAALGGACTNGTSVSGSPNILAVHQAVCAAFPSIVSYGTYRAGSTDHASGRAIDIMVSGSMGWDVANFVRSNYAAFGVSYVIYSQQIWSVDRGGEGWRWMSDRGSTTANHYDHVHVSTY